MVRNPRGGLKVGETQTDRTDFSFADRYLEDRRKYKYWRIQVNYPFVPERSAPGNIDFESEELRRSYREKIPHESIDMNNLTTSRTPTLKDMKYRFISDAPNASNIPEGYYGTSSGIYPIDFIPFSIGDPTNIPITINYDYKPVTTTSGEFYFVLVDNYKEIINTVYYPLDQPSQGVMMEWQIQPSFDNPTEPTLRFPRGALRRK